MFLRTRGGKTGFILSMTVLGLGLLSGASAILDIDTDGYVGVLQGGDDCVDQTHAVFMNGTPECDDGQPPVYLNGQYDIVDHAWVADGTTYHLYSSCCTISNTVIYRYTSTDLRTLSAPTTVFGPNPGAWDHSSIWAPYVIEHAGVYYLFYTGVDLRLGEADQYQRIGLATSTDLVTWTRAPVNNCSDPNGDGCVYECDEPWTTWGDGGDFDNQCRDPMVVRDEANGRWVLFATTRHNASTQAVAVATSTDLLNWTGTGYIEASARVSTGVLGQLTGGVAENPFVTAHDGTFYLSWTDYWDTEDFWYTTNPRTAVQYATSTTLDADPTGSANWTYRGYTPDPGVNGSEVQVLSGDTWILTQSIMSGYSGAWPEQRRNLRVKRIEWNGDGTYTTENNTDLACRVPSAAINPGVPEQCGDSVDNDCDAGVDEPMCVGVCADADGDGYGTSGTLSCSQPALDCNDANPSINPGVTEICDTIDNNCDGRVNEGNVCRRRRVFQWISDGQIEIAKKL